MSRNAADRLGRILHILAVARRSAETTLDAIASEVGTTPEEVLDALTEVQGRSYYHPAGFEDDVQIVIEGKQVSVFTGHRFHRPPRLTTREAVALELALRTAAASDPDRSERLDALAGRIRPEIEPEEATNRIDLSPTVPDDPITTLLHGATRARHRVRLLYSRPGKALPSERIVRPYALVHAEGTLYLLGACERVGGVRSFRLDRIVDCELAGGEFAVPDDFAVEDHLSEGRVFTPPADALEVEVRYSASIARWISERESVVREMPDGSIVVLHLVADPDWMIRHVLQYGPEAEILAPSEMRERIQALSLFRKHARPGP